MSDSVPTSVYQAFNAVGMVNKQRIVHVIDHLGAGGAQQLVADIVPRQQRAGLVVAIVCLRGPTPLAQGIAQAGVPIYYIGRHRLDPRQYRELRALFAELRPDVLHLHLTAACLIGRLFLGRHGIRGLLIHDHEASAEIYITPGPLLALRRLLERDDWKRNISHVVISRSALAYATAVRRLRPSQVVLIPNGVDIAALAADRLTRAAARALFGVPADISLIVCAGRLAPEKGIDILIAALAQLNPDVHVLLAGRGPREQELRQQAAVLGVADRVHFTGHLSDVRPALWAADVYVQPSRREAFGLAAAEASALGIPVVASATGGLRDVIRDRVSGILVPSEQPVALSVAIQSILQDPLLASRMGDAGRLHAQQFEISRIVEQFSRYYQRLISTDAQKGAANEPV